MCRTDTQPVVPTFARQPTVLPAALPSVHMRLQTYSEAYSTQNLFLANWYQLPIS